MANVTELALDTIRVSADLQPRAMMNAVTIEEYREEMENGTQFPPLTVFYDGETYWLADGFHRWQAAKAAERASIRVEVRQGSKRDAILHSVQANATHGLRRSAADKRKAVITLLEDHQWSHWSDREIARRTRTSHPFVAKIRQETGNVTSERTYEDRHGNVTTMKTEKISESNRERAQEEEDRQGPPPDWAPTLKAREEVPSPEPEERELSSAPVQAPAPKEDTGVPKPERKPDLPPPQEQIKPRVGVLTVRINDGDEMSQRPIMVSLGDEGRGPTVFFRGVMEEMPRLLEKAMVQFYGDRARAIFGSNGRAPSDDPVRFDPRTLPFDVGDVVTWLHGSGQLYGKVESFSGSGEKAYVRTTNGQRQIVKVNQLEKVEQ